MRISDWSSDVCSSDLQPTLLALMTRFEDAWKQLEATPENNDLRNQVVLRGVELTTEIRRLNGLQSTLQTRARESIELDIQDINTASVEIAKLNTQIASQMAGGDRKSTRLNSSH